MTQSNVQSDMDCTVSTDGQLVWCLVLVFHIEKRGWMTLGDDAGAPGREAGL